MSSQSVSSSVKKTSALPKNLPFLQDLLNCFRSVHLAIVLLSLLAIGTIIGVVMPQEGMVDIAEIAKRYGNNFKLYQTLGYYKVYNSFWFITLQILFFFNLLIGSFKWLKPATLAAIQKYTFTPEMILQKPEVHSLPVLAHGSREALEKSLTETLKKFRYNVYQGEQGNLYASKGNLTRIGPSLAHLGILLCLIGGVYSSFTGFKAVKMAVPGESFTIAESNTFKTNMPPNFWLGEVPNWKVKVNDFRIDYYEDHPETAKQYYSDLQIISPEGKVLTEQTISVNHPLSYDDVMLYQSSFSPTGRFLLTVDGNPMTVEVNNNFNDRPISINPLSNGSTLIMFPFFALQDPGVKENFAVFFIRKPGEEFPEGEMPPTLKLKQGESGEMNGTTVTYLNPEMSTGLQIKRSPEVPLMYLSYIIISLGTVLCFFSQRQLWVTLREVAPKQFEVLMHPKTNKARLSFHRELGALETSILSQLKTTKT